MTVQQTQAAPAASLDDIAAEGLRRLDAGDYGEAERLLRAVHGLTTASFAVNRGLGIALAARGDYAAAFLALRDAAVLQDDPLTYNVLSVCLYALERYEQALVCADQALVLLPGFTEALSNRGNALNRLGRWAEAVEALQAALGLEPDDPELHVNIANPLRDLGRAGEALAHLDRAFAIDPAGVLAHTNRGNVLQDLGRHAEAVESYDRALAIDPAALDAQWNRALCCLLLGRLEEGWRGYECRWLRGTPENEPRKLAAPLWLGQADLNGRSILVYCEQGLGDSIQFVRYVRALADRGARVVLEAYPPLLELFRSAAGVAELIPAGARLPATDFQCPLMSLPLALGGPPEPAAYLAAPEERLGRWRERLGPRARLRVGVVNRGRPTHGADKRRSLALEALAAALPAGADYHLLLKSGTLEDHAVAGRRADFTVWDDAVQDLADSAALWSLMDVVVTIDSGPAHLAGALGVPTSILIPYDPDWRWGLEGERTAWYPSATLYRQDVRDDWSGPLERIRQHLGRLV